MQTTCVNLICSYSVCAGHRLYRDDWSQDKNHKIFGKCVRNHGHQYRIEVILGGGIDVQTGMLINGFDVDEIVRPIVIERLDHKFLNDDIDFFKDHQPTAEWIAFWIFHELQDKFASSVALKAVRVFETPELAAEYSATNE